VLSHYSLCRVTRARRGRTVVAMSTTLAPCAAFRWRVLAWTSTRSEGEQARISHRAARTSVARQRHGTTLRWDVNGGVSSAQRALNFKRAPSADRMGSQLASAEASAALRPVKPDAHAVA